MLYRSGYWFLWEIVGSAALGYLVGLLLAGWSAHVTERGEMLILLAGSILFCVGASRAIGLSPLVTSLAVGATMVNLAERSGHLFKTLSSTDPPFYAMFFVIAGAELDVSRIPEMGALGLVYVVGRAGGKFAGARLASRWLGLGPSVQRFLGFALQAQAGLAVGLTLAVNSRYPQLAPVVSTVVLASVAVFEMIGPASARFALTGAGEVGVARTSSHDPQPVEFNSRLSDFLPLAQPFQAGDEIIADAKRRESQAAAPIASRTTQCVHGVPAVGARNPCRPRESLPRLCPRSTIGKPIGRRHGSLCIWVSGVGRRGRRADAVGSRLPEITAAKKNLTNPPGGYLLLDRLTITRSSPVCAARRDAFWIARAEPNE